MIFEPKKGEVGEDLGLLHDKELHDYAGHPVK
jgi:hypothetical protein